MRAADDRATDMLTPPSRDAKRSNRGDAANVHASLGRGQAEARAHAGLTDG